MKERKVPDPSLNPGHGPALSRICLLVLGYPCDLARHERLPPLEYEFWHPVDQLFLKPCMS